MVPVVPALALVVFPTAWIIRTLEWLFALEIS
jgi:hypothetical protein